MEPTTYLDKIKQKKQAAAEAADKQAVIDTIKSSGGETKDSVTTAMHDLLLATLVGKDPRIVEVSKNLAELLTSISAASDKIKDSGLDSISKSIDTTFNKIITALDNLPEKVSATDKSGELIPHLQSLERTFKTTRTVVTPNVTVNPKLDLEPLKAALLESKATPDTEDLSSYKAQDLSDDGGSMQYVGFLNPEGNWYIIENDTEGNSLRYKFGKGDYQKAWGNKVGQRYTLLNEAINAIRS